MVYQLIKNTFMKNIFRYHIQAHDLDSDGVASGQVFGLSLSKCLENERSRIREAAERAAAAAAAAAATPVSSVGEDGDAPLSRKSSHAGSQASFSSLIEGTKQVRSLVWLCNVCRMDYDILSLVYSKGVQIYECSFECQETSSRSYITTQRCAS